MKNLDKVNQLTNNPFTLLAGMNHFYLNKVFVGAFRVLITVLGGFVVLLSIILEDQYLSAFIFMGVIWCIYFTIDKFRIKKHVDNYNSKFSEVLVLLRDKKFFKAFKKMVKLGLKENILWIMDNQPEVLSGSLLSHISKEDFLIISKQIEQKDVNGIMYTFKKLALGI